MPTLGLANEDDARRVAAELSELGAIPHAIRDSEQGFRVGGDDVELKVLARALDHLRNSGDASGELEKSRDNLLERLGSVPLSYRLRSWQFSASEQDQLFWSYTGPYAKGDRLVNAAGDAFRVREVVRDGTASEEGLLVVARWK